MLQLPTRIKRFLMGDYARVSQRVLLVVAGLTIGAILLAGTIVRFTDTDEFSTVWEGWWWAATTVTTVGYGDLVPDSTTGRLAAVALMFTGIALVSILTAALASALLAEDVGDEERHIDRQLDRLLDAVDRIEQRLAAIEGRSLDAAAQAEPDC